MLALFLGLVIFLGIHSIGIVAPHWRDRVKFHWGTGRWRMTYSALSLVGFGLLLYGFSVARHSPSVLYSPGYALRWAARVFMVPVFPLLLAAYLPGHIQRSTKHPMLAAVKFWALAHLLANGTAADVLLFGSFLVWAVIDRIALKRNPRPPPVSLRFSVWNDLIAVVLGLGIYVWMLEWLHFKVFGVSPLG